MALVWSIKRIVTALAVLGGTGVVGMNAGAVKAYYQGIYPDDPARQEALDMCFMENHMFNRLSAGARDACYKRMLPTLGEFTPSRSPNVNLIDLQRAAAEGSMPRNDIVRLQETQRAAAHSPH